MFFRVLVFPFEVCGIVERGPRVSLRLKIMRIRRRVVIVQLIGLICGIKTFSLGLTCSCSG